MVQEHDRLPRSTGVPHDLVLEGVTLNRFSEHAYPATATPAVYSAHSQAVLQHRNLQHRLEDSCRVLCGARWPSLPSSVGARDHEERASDEPVSVAAR